MIVATMSGSGRAMRVAAYMLLVVGGITLITQLDSWELPVIKPLWYVLAVWLGLGGALSCVGQIARRWTGEFVGLPLIASALIGLGVLQANLASWSIEVWTSTALLWGFGLIVLSRWRDVLALYRAAPQLVKTSSR